MSVWRSVVVSCIKNLYVICSNIYHYSSQHMASIVNLNNCIFYLYLFFQVYCLYFLTHSFNLCGRKQVLLVCRQFKIINQHERHYFFCWLWAINWSFVLKSLYKNWQSSTMIQMKMSYKHTINCLVNIIDLKLVHEELKIRIFSLVI